MPVHSLTAQRLESHDNDETVGAMPLRAQESTLDGHKVGSALFYLIVTFRRSSYYTVIEAVHTDWVAHALRPLNSPRP